MDKHKTTAAISRKKSNTLVIKARPSINTARSRCSWENQNRDYRYEARGHLLNCIRGSAAGVNDSLQEEIEHRFYREAITIAKRELRA